MNITARADLIYNDFAKRLTLANKKELAYNLTKNLLLTSLIFFALGFLIILLEAIFRFGTTERMILFWGFISTFSTTVIYFAGNYFLKRAGIIKPFDLISYSRRVGNNFEEVKDSLSNSLSLYRGVNGGSVFSGELIAANLETVNERTKGINFSSYISYSNLKRYTMLLFGSVLFYTLMFIVFPGPLTASVNRLVNYNYNFITNDLGIAFNVTPGHTDVVKGEKVTVKVSVTANKPEFKAEEIQLVIKEITKDGVEILADERDLESGADGIFTTDIENINNNLIYYAEYEGIRSDEYKITVSDYPIVKSFTVTIYPPEFTGMPSKTLGENEGDIVAPEGSRIYFDLKSNKKLSSAGVVLNENFVNFDVTESGAAGSISAVNGTYKFALKDENGSENRNPNVYNIKVMNDEAPVISIIEPEDANYTLKAERELLVRARISDDFGFSKLTLSYRKNNSRSSAAGNFAVINIPIKNLNATSLEVPYIWNVSALGLRSGDMAEYYMEVTDNTGKTTRSETRTLQYRSLSEIIKQSEKLTQELKSNLNSIMQDAQNLNQDMKDLKKEMQNNEELGLNDPKQRQELQQKVENLQNNLNETQNKIEQSLNELQQKNMLNDKTLEQYMKMQELFNKVNTPEFREMLKKLQEALKKNNREEMKEAMKNFNFDEEAFKKQMEQVMELMKKIENLQKFGELTQKLDDITKQQEQLKNETENADQNNKDKMNELSNKQQDIKNQTQEFKDELKKLIDELNKMKDENMGAEDLEKLKQNMEQKQTDNKMNQSKDQLQKSEKQNSEQTQQDIMKDLNEMNDQMQDALGSMMDMQNMDNKMMQKMNQIKKQLEELSKKQQELKEQTEEIEQGDKQEFENKQKEQKQLQDRLNEAINDLMSTTKNGAQISPEMGKELGNAFNKMDKAGDNLQKGNKNNASDNQGDAKESLDKAGDMLGDMMSQMSKQGDGKSGKNGNGKMGQLMQQLANLISQQQGLNGKMPKMGENGQTGKDGKEGKGDMTGEQRGEMDRLRMEQEQITKSFEQLNKEFEEEQRKTGEKVLGDMNQVQKDMQEIVKEMSEYNVTDETIEKQNKILSRMLDAQLSQREKDFEQKRESKPGQNYSRTSPPEVVLSGPNSFNALKEDFLKLQKEGYTEDYEALITKYLLELKKNGYNAESSE